MILVWGSREDPPTARILEELQARGAAAVHLEDADLPSLSYDVTLGKRPRGWLETGGRRIELDAIDAMYLRPGVRREGRATTAGACLIAVASCLDAVVVNRPVAGRSNMSKPFQLAQIAEAGFAVPATLVTTDPLSARSFLDRNERLVYKSISGVRSIVATLDSGQVDRLGGVGTGPVQLQRWISGIDIRVHVVGKRWFATGIESSADDYRYSAAGGQGLSMAQASIDPEVGSRLVQLASAMGLLVAGIDLRLTPDDEWFCFEVNPSPGFTFYEDATGQPIGAAIADLLTTPASGLT